LWPSLCGIEGKSETTANKAVATEAVAASLLLALEKELTREVEGRLEAFHQQQKQEFLQRNPVAKFHEARTDELEEVAEIPAPAAELPAAKPVDVLKHRNPVMPKEPQAAARPSPPMPPSPVVYVSLGLEHLRWVREKMLKDPRMAGGLTSERLKDMQAMYKEFDIHFDAFVIQHGNVDQYKFAIFLIAEMGGHYHPGYAESFVSASLDDIDAWDFTIGTTALRALDNIIREKEDKWNTVEF